jgi:hypothetical protein
MSDQQEPKTAEPKTTSYLKEEYEKLSHWAKLVIWFVGLAIALKILIWCRVLDLLIYFVIIPLGFLTLLGALSEERANELIEASRRTFNALKNAAKEK